MKRLKTMNVTIKPIVIACALALAADQAAAIDYYLAAKQYIKQLPMADGTLVDVPMWGYVVDPGGVCYDAASNATRLTCVDALPDPVVPGPVLSVPFDQTALQIFLSNGLSQATSVIIPGQELPYSGTDNGPTWNNGTTGGRGNDLTKKVRSYTREAAADGGRQIYVWNDANNNPISNSGTFMYHSGTTPQLQVYMGLYGAVTKDAAPGEVYPGVAYTNETTLFYSEIDKNHNDAVAAGDPNYTPIDYHPQWFLINGEPYAAGTTQPIPAGTSGEPNLLRFLSAASEKHVPVLQGMHGTIHAEDGIQYNWQDGVTGAITPAPRQQYSVGLPPLKTKDVIVTPTAGGDYAVYDGNGYMTNPSDPENPDDGGDTLGGMLRFLSFAQGANNLAPEAVSDELTIVFAEGTTAGGTTPVIGTVNVLANDSDPEGATLSLVASDATTPEIGGTVTCDNITGECTFEPASDGTTFAYITGTGTFNYTVSDGNITSADTQGTVTVTVTENLAPTPVADSVTVDTGVVANFNILANDTDPEGDTLTFTLDTLTTPLLGSLTCDDGTGGGAVGDCTYTPPANPTLPLTETFTYTIEDGINPASAATEVTITVTTPTPTAPVGVNDTFTMAEDGVLDVAAPGVLENDTDANGDSLTAMMVIPPSHARPDPNNPGGFLFSFGSNGSFHYEPDANFVGEDSFSYLPSDGGAVESNITTVTITVEPQNDTPVANNDILYLQDATFTNLDPDGQPLDVTFSIAAPGVLANDVDVDMDSLTATEVGNPDVAVLAADGSASGIQITNSAVGVLWSASYEASDPQGAVSNTAQADFVRLITLTRSDYLENGNNPANSDWRIAGTVDPSISNSGGTQAILAWLQRRDATGALLNEEPLNPTVTNANNGRIRNNRTFTLNANNIGSTLLPGPYDTLRVEIDSSNANVTTSNPDYDLTEAIYTGYPINIVPPQL